MCGIAGILNFDRAPVSPVILRRMTDAIAHRGPDGEGHYIDGPLGLGHRRLAIIDLSPAGQQPMASGDYVISYNGEVYNFRELKVELESLGHQFHSKTDTEVVIHAYLAWGERCVERFNGMFALAIWDKRRHELFLARDRYGIKPLYYALSSRWLLFGSEQKALLAHPELRPAVDREALVEYFTFQNIFTDRTLLQGVKLFPAGCWAKVALGRPVAQLEPVRYWDYDFGEPEHPLSEDEYLEELNRLFCQAVNRQLVSDVDVGCYLSGGMDSGSITAVAGSQLPYISTFTCGFDLSSASGLELGFDERKRAEHMSYLFKTEHYEMVLKAGDMERCLPTLAYHLEEPRVGQSYPNYYAAKLASRFVKVVLSGAGGDELFGGYPWRYYRAVVNDNFEDYVDKYFRYWKRLIPTKDVTRVFQPIWDDVREVQTRDIFANVFKKHEHRLSTPADYINHSLYFEAKTFLHGLLVVEDKISMAHSLETRVPFLDNDLVDFAQRIPVSLKLRSLDQVVRIDENEPGKEQKYFQKTNDGKIILRRAMERYIPGSVTNAEKQGFSAPDASWFKGESIDYVRRNLLEGNPLIYQYLDRKVVHELVDDHLSGRQNRRLFIWSLLNVEQWLKQYAEDK
ncbi:asparagine synthase (glutamine-hydrolyzing) [Geomonas sp. Red69]|uniref:asparagine synthase (glutamine-hydrolyzing) n=1 Tax=Geomonas diazotrophica TaxID=2843197 RepID=A0ABX8JET2_9BACT|nr:MULTISPECIES: asparagine synthase (glutamine-hydrolyzing) [Geomonas]MBU5636085.1 asparagine synthase (glutamine-hydrolyzing) [Geomonas diazotrophica]QWV95987.1 asparagine synthase (glutamine-hydrolyzing) [Geomonas nitrogeniifigens]QXE85054.1 asparagine synthase (glutamine-hydrolyzing) [Geomonas nitrogeniifigens]